MQHFKYELSLGNRTHSQLRSNWFRQMGKGRSQQSAAKTALLFGGQRAARFQAAAAVDAAPAKHGFYRRKAWVSGAQFNQFADPRLDGPRLGPFVWLSEAPDFNEEFGRE